MPSFDRPRDTAIPPSPWILRFLPLVRPGGKVLDVAAGHGRHTRWLLQAGFGVVAVDVETGGLEDLAGHGDLEILTQDLEAGPWPLGERRFDAIVMANYLHRPLFPALAAALEPGGVLLIETFGAGNEQWGRPRNPDFLLHPGELLTAFGSVLEVVAYEHGYENEPRPAVRQRFCGRKPAPGAAPPALPSWGALGGVGPGSGPD